MACPFTRSPMGRLFALFSLVVHRLHYRAANYYFFEGLLLAQCAAGTKGNPKQRIAIAVIVTVVRRFIVFTVFGPYYPRHFEKSIPSPVDHPRQSRLDRSHPGRPTQPLDPRLVPRAMYSCRPRSQPVGTMSPNWISSLSLAERLTGCGGHRCQARAGGCLAYRPRGS